MISITKLSKSYSKNPQTNKLLENINLEIPKGGWISIIGPSGVGKSTLLKCISGIEQPSEGRVFYNETSLYDLKESERSNFRRKHIGFVFQDFRLLPYYSTIENVMLPLVYDESKNNLEKRAKQLLINVGIEEKHFNRLPESLSGGEKQRVAFARALIASPDVILCDEPTGNLDPVNRDNMVVLLQLLKSQGQTIIVVTHDYEVASYSDRVYELQLGTIAQKEVI